MRHIETRSTLASLPQDVPITPGDQMLPEVANPGQFSGQGASTLSNLLGQGGRIIDFNARKRTLVQNATAPCTAACCCSCSAAEPQAGTSLAWLCCIALLNRMDSA